MRWDKIVTGRRAALASLFAVPALISRPHRVEAFVGGVSCAGSYVVTPQQFGAVGDGVHDDTAAIQAAVDYCFGPANNPHSAANAHKNQPLYFPSGVYSITSPIVFTSVHGGVIAGAGRFSTSIINSLGTACFTTNGFEYSQIGGIQFKGSGSTTPVIDLDWDGTGSAALQSNTFADCEFESGGIGVRIGNSQHMGSENLFQNCFFASQAIAGLSPRNYNALQQTVLGGNFQACDVGILVEAGSVPIIHGVGFQLNTSWDIQIVNQANDSYSVAGCRTESVNFISNLNHAALAVIGCSQTNANPGQFLANNGPAALVGCTSVAGTVLNTAASDEAALIRIACKFPTPWLVNTIDGPTTSLDGQSPQIGPHTNNNNTGTTITAAQIVGGIVVRTGTLNSGFADTTDTAANIINSYPSNQYYAIRDTSSQMPIRFRVVNQTSQTMTLNGGTGVTMVGLNTISSTNSHDFIGIITDPATPLISFYG